MAHLVSDDLISSHDVKRLVIVGTEGSIVYIVIAAQVAIKILNGAVSIEDNAVVGDELSRCLNEIERRVLFRASGGWER